MGLIPDTAEGIIVPQSFPDQRAPLMSWSFSLARLEALPTIRQGHFDNLKVEYQNYRLWLSRMTVADGALHDHMVVVEHLNAKGEWLEFLTYQAR